MLIKLLIAVIAFLGLVVGYILTFVAREEIKSGQKYFFILRRLILIALAITLLSSVWATKSFVIPLVIGMIIGLFVHVTYFYLGFALAASVTLPMNIFVVIAALVFLYGLPYGGSSFKVAFPFHAVLFFIPLLVMLFFSPNNVNLLLPLVAGLLILQK